MNLHLESFIYSYYEKIMLGKGRVHCDSIKKRLSLVYATKSSNVTQNDSMWLHFIFVQLNWTFCGAHVFVGNENRKNACPMSICNDIAPQTNIICIWLISNVSIQPYIIQNVMAICNQSYIPHSNWWCRENYFIVSYKWYGHACSIRLPQYERPNSRGAHMDFSVITLVPICMLSSVITMIAGMPNIVQHYSWIRLGGIQSDDIAMAGSERIKWQARRNRTDFDWFGPKLI